MLCPQGKPEVQLILIILYSLVCIIMISYTIHYVLLYMFSYIYHCVLKMLSCTYILENELRFELKFIIIYMVIDDHSFVNCFIKK